MAEDERTVKAKEFIEDFQRYIHCGRTDLFYCDIEYQGLGKSNKKKKSKNKKKVKVQKNDEAPGTEKAGPSLDPPKKKASNSKKRKGTPWTGRPLRESLNSVSLANSSTIRSLNLLELEKIMDIAKEAVNNGLVRKHELFKVLVRIILHMDEDFKKAIVRSIPKKKKNFKKRGKGKPTRSGAKSNDPPLSKPVEKKDKKKKERRTREELKAVFKTKRKERKVKYYQRIALQTSYTEKANREKARKKYAEMREKRKPIYEGLPDLIHNFDELTLFLKMYRKINVPDAKTDEHGKSLKKAGIGFSTMFRKFVKRWYENQDKEKLINMLATNRSSNGLAHRDIFKLLHPACVELNLEETSENLFKKLLILDYAHHRAGQFQIGTETVPQECPELQMCADKLSESCKLKVEREPKQALKTMKENDFCIEHLPSCLIICEEMWKELLAHDKDNPSQTFITYQRLLQRLFLLNDKGFLQANSDITAGVVAKLQDKSLLAQEKIHPFTLFHYYSLFKANMRYLTQMKEADRAPKPAAANTVITDALKNAFEMSFDLYPKKEKYRCFITIDVRYSMESKKIFSRHQHIISVLDTALIIAKTFMKISDKCKVFTYGRDVERDQRETLEDISDPSVLEIDFKKEVEEHKLTDNIESMREVCTFPSRIRKKVVRNMEMPIKKAIDSEQWANVFITITDGVCNVCPRGNLPTNLLNEYAEKSGIDDVKYVVIGLSRHRQDIARTSFLEPDDKRVLEVAGFTSDTAKVIESFLDGNFH